MTIGQRIKEARKTAGLTQRELAERAGTATGTIQQYELGKRQPRLEQLLRIAAALNVSVYLFLDEKEQQIFDVGSDEGIGWGEHGLEKDLKFRGYSFSETEQELIEIFGYYLNEKGRRKVVSYAIDISGNIEYRRQDAPQSTPPASDGTPDGSEPQEGEE